ncbi:unnamed protein product [Microthlaspi erraticum]|uniref:F-box domain-containing protein n=1 Tax=Microthlaspi erraticum TaxID=1685480 RepID=A0A6D2KQ46_9BRAS|nr:unnamed protein product [Microthlaspi erraticum]
MLGRVLIVLGSTWLVGQLVKKRLTGCKRIRGEDKISALPEDLLVRILLLLPTKDAVTTMILSKRWLSVWKMVPRLDYKEIKEDVGTHKRFLGGLLGRLLGKSERQKSVWRFLNESLPLHKAPVLYELLIELGPHCPVDAEFGKLIANAIVDRRVLALSFHIMWSAEPTVLPTSLYMCNTLVCLRLHDKVLVDVSSQACLPSLTHLDLIYVTYKDEDSLIRLLSSCPILKHLYVMRIGQDNVTKFSVKVPSLERLDYLDAVPRVLSEEDIGGSLVIDSASLTTFLLADASTNSCWIENKLSLDKALIYVFSFPGDEFLTSLSSVTYLELLLSSFTVACCEAIDFSQLIDCKLHFTSLDWIEPFVLLLQNSPKLKVLLIEERLNNIEAFPLSWNQPSSVPECLSNNLEIFEWNEYGGTNEEKEVARYIFANSKCLKRAGISLKKSVCKGKEREDDGRVRIHA